MEEWTNHASLESLLPAVEVHRRKLRHGRAREVDVERLTLIDECSLFTARC
jgi:hypothetical protein